MKRFTKASLIVIPLVLLSGLACLIWLASRRNEPGQTVGLRVLNTSRSPTFEVNVDKPRMDRPFAGLLPARLEAYLVGGELRFDNASRGAKVGSVDKNHVELGAEGWDLLIETDGEGKISQGTHLIFPIEIANVQWSLRCRPADPAVGFLNASTRPSTSESKTSSESRTPSQSQTSSDSKASSDSKTSGVLDGRFVIELARCEDSKTGKILDTEAGGNPGDAWPSSPLTLRGTFAGLPHGRR